MRAALEAGGLSVIDQLNLTPTETGQTNRTSVTGRDDFPLRLLPGRVPYIRLPHGGPIVRIHLPPAASQARPRPSDGWRVRRATPRHGAGPDQCGAAKEPRFHYETEPLIGDERPRLYRLSR